MPNTRARSLTQTSTVISIHATKIRLWNKKWNIIRSNLSFWFQVKEKSKKEWKAGEHEFPGKFIQWPKAPRSRIWIRWSNKTSKLTNRTLYCDGVLCDMQKIAPFASSCKTNISRRKIFSFVSGFLPSTRFVICLFSFVWIKKLISDTNAECVHQTTYRSPKRMCGVYRWISDVFPNLLIRLPTPKLWQSHENLQSCSWKWICVRYTQSVHMTHTLVLKGISSEIFDYSISNTLTLKCSTHSHNQIKCVFKLKFVWKLW